MHVWLVDEAKYNDVEAAGPKSLMFTPLPERMCVTARMWFGE